MRVLAGIAAVALIAAMLAEFFFVFLLPRRVRRDPRIARRVLRGLWLPWRAAARRLPRGEADTVLGIFGPFGLLAILGTLSLGMILGYAGLHFALESRFAGRPGSSFGGDLYFSAAAFFSANGPTPRGGLEELLQVVEAASGFAFLAIAIGYLPALFQAFSRREAAVARLDPRAGSPPSAGALLARTAEHGSWSELDAYLREWENWTAELMETHLSYPVLGYFRSQHLNQNWLAALTTIVDACAYAIAFGPPEEVESAELTFRIGRHALADLALTLAGDPPFTPMGGPAGRLTPEMLVRLRERLAGTGLHAVAGPGASERLNDLRAGYEHYALALAAELALELPGWVTEAVEHNWATETGHGRRTSLA